MGQPKPYFKITSKLPFLNQTKKRRREDGGNCTYKLNSGKRRSTATFLSET